MKRLALIAAAVLLLQACSPRHFQPVSEASRTEVRVDSVMVVDSVYIDRIRTIREKADTVYVTDWKTEYKYKYLDRVKVDTLVVTQKETVTEVREVERKLTAWQTFRLRAFWYLLGIVAVALGWRRIISLLRL